jgi:hypothetical protein
MDKIHKHTNGSRLEELAKLARDAGAERIAKEVQRLSQRVREGLFYVACIGQFKRGKSTLVNALVGEPVLPVSVVPVTAVVTVLRYGPMRTGRVRLADGGWQDIDLSELASYVSEEDNPENRKEESARRIEALRVFTADAERSLSDLSYLFNAEQDRLARVFSDRKDRFIARATADARRELAERIAAVEPCGGLALRDRAIEFAHEISQHWLDQWLAEAQPAAEALYIEATQRFVDLANNFLERLTNTEDPALTVMPRLFPKESGFRVKSRLFYTSLMTLTSQSLLQWLLDLLRPRKLQIKALNRQIGDYGVRLIYVNSHRVEADFNDRVMESRRSLQYEIKAALTEVVTSADSSLDRANKRRAQGSQAVQTEVDRINALSERLAALSSNRL